MSGFFPSLETFAKGTFATVAGLSTLSVGLVYYGQNYLIYPSAFPPGSRTEVARPSDFELPYEDLELKTSDDVTLRCYLLLQKKDVGHAATYMDIPNSVTEDEFIASRPTVIMFHGNGGNMGHRIPLAGIFYRKMRCNVLMMCYRGYGHSDGSPSEKGLRIDAQTALDYLTSNPVLKQTAIVLYGQSIGGAVAIDLASRNPDKICALILENTFTSLPSLVPHALPILGPFSFLCHQKWDSASKIPLIPATTPILMLSGAKDEIVPREHMRALWEAVAKRGEKKKPNGSEYKVGLERAKYMEFENGQHNNTCTQPGYWTAVAEFVASLGDSYREKHRTPPRSGL
ncbi:Protein bem46 [Psilocybe cubensis]|uniref:Protein bem46 n=2 Tax=Psilocybe cubensis TaxID=181762 RepID=A0ACB8GKP7_PSICU|nr:Protein bem46 [Psilocybe cubensis]KAH9476116.1 Protein bem46 [Psilocybe cubensis]